MNHIGLLFLAILLSLTAAPQTAFRSEVTGKGEPVILIPGYSCSGEVWNETVARLRQHKECHVITLAGYAGVPPVAAPVLATVKQAIIDYTKEKKLRKPILIGHSLGAFMALWLASEQPDLFGKVICVDGVPFVSALSNPAVHADSLKKDPGFDPEAVVRNFMSQPDSGFIDKTARSLSWQVADPARARQIATWQYQSDRRTLALTFVEMSTTDLRKNISRITQPVLVLGSIYFTKENSYKLLGDQFRLLPGAIIRVADSRHFIMYDQFEWFYKQVEDFLRTGASQESHD